MLFFMGGDRAFVSPENFSIFAETGDDKGTSAA
jgi:hypothetical protein